MKDNTLTLGLLCGGYLLIVLMAFIPTILWYCIDDRLAAMTGIPVLGVLPFTFVFPLTILLMFLFKGSSTQSGS